MLDRAAALVKPGGRIAYITCSVLPPENGAQVRAFIGRHPEFSVVPPEQTASVLWDKAEDFAKAALEIAGGLADDAEADRDGRVFRVGAEAKLNLCSRHCARDTPAVIARSDATKQSILPLCRAMDCFASLAMTAI